MTEAEEAIQSILSGKDEDKQPTATEEQKPSTEESKPAEESTPNNTNPGQTTPPDSTNPDEKNPPPASTEDTTPPEQPKKPSEHTPQERAEFAFRRQLARQREKYEAQLKEQADKFAEMQKELDELKKSTSPKKTLKREEFQDDEEFIRALQQEEINKALEAHDARQAEEAKKKAEESEKAEAARQELEQQQKLWMDNVSAAFNGDEARKKNFTSRVQYCLERGLGELLDRVPVASDYLLYNPRGPIVFERMLNDRAAFEKVFNERYTPMDIYFELRRLDEAIAAEKPAEQQTTQTQQTQKTQTTQTTPHIGKPGQQSTSNAKPDIFTDDDEMIRYLRSQY